jgi:hypothetical protein
MTSEPFLKPRLTGPRFEGGAIPLEVLADFSVLAEMVVEVAKWKFFTANPDRKQVSRGFANDISLKLTGIESGSAVPVISLFVAGAVLFPNSAAQPYFEQARQAIVEAVGAAEQNRSITPHLPERLLGYFDRFGRNLMEGEAIELTGEPGRAPVRLTKETRRRLIRASAAEEFTEETAVHGLVPEFDQRSKTFQLARPDGTILGRIPVESQHYDTVLAAFTGFRERLRVRVAGVGRFDLNNRLQAIEKVEHVTLLDPLDVGVRIDELKALKAGWLDGKGAGLDRAGLDWLEAAFTKHYPVDLPLPYLFPTPEGHVLAEWSLKPWSPSLEVRMDGRRGEWHALSVDTDVEEANDLDLTNPADWAWLAGRIDTLSRTPE